MARPATPPTAPPTMAPVCEDEDEELPLLDASTPAVAVETTVWVMTDVYVDPLGDVPLHRGEERRRKKMEDVHKCAQRSGCGQ